jgi:hypothetical protein
MQFTSSAGIAIDVGTVPLERAAIILLGSTAQVVVATVVVVTITTRRQGLCPLWEALAEADPQCVSKWPSGRKKPLQGRSETVGSAVALAKLRECRIRLIAPSVSTRSTWRTPSVPALAVTKFVLYMGVRVS